MFYLLPSWIWFNTKLYLSCEAGTWKLGLGHLPSPQHWPCWLKQISHCRVVSPRREVGAAFLVPPLLFAASQALSHLLSLHCSVPPSLLLHCKVLNFLKLQKFCKSATIGWQVKVRPAPPARKLFHVLKCESNLSTNQECFMACGASKNQTCPYTDIWLSLFNQQMISRFYWWWSLFQSTEPGHDWVNPPCCDFILFPRITPNDSADTTNGVLWLSQKYWMRNQHPNADLLL